MQNRHDAVPGEPRDRVNAYEYLIVLARYRWRIVAIVVLGSVLVGAYTLVQRQTYSATAVLMPPEKSEGINFSELLGKSGGFDIGGFTENSASEVLISMLQSRSLSDSLIDRLGLLKHYGLGPNDRQKAMEILQSSLDVSADRQGVLTITCDQQTAWMPSKDNQQATAGFAADVANAAHEVLDNLSREKSVSSARLSREFIGRMREIKRRELDSVQREFLRFQESNSAIALDKQVEASVIAIAELQSLIQKTDLELQTALQDLEPSTPKVQSLRAQLARLRQQRSELESGRSGTVPFAISMKSVPELTRQYANLKLDLEVSTEVYTYLEAQYHKEQVQEARDLPTIRVLDYAVPSTIRSAPRRTLTVLIAAVSLLFASVLGAFVADGVGRQVRGASDARVEELRAVLRGRRGRAIVGTTENGGQVRRES